MMALPSKPSFLVSSFRVWILACGWLLIMPLTKSLSKLRSPQANSELFFFQTRMKVDVNIVLPSEIVVWTAFTNKPQVNR